MKLPEISDVNMLNILQPIRKLFILLVLFPLILQGCSSIQPTSDIVIKRPFPTVATVTNSIPTVTSASKPFRSTTLAQTQPTAITPSLTSNTTGKFPSTTPLVGWQYHWLKEIPCRAPCFEGITPGVTNAREAEQILKKNSLVARVKVETGVLRWDWVDGLGSLNNQSGWGGRAYYESATSAQTIDYIEPELRTTFKLSEVIASYGEPSHVSAKFQTGYTRSTSGIYYSIEVLYMDLGIALFTLNGVKKDVDSKLYFERLTFFIPGDKGYQLAFPQDEYRLLVPWKGYNTFNFYCQYQLKNGDKKCSDV